MAGLQGSNSNNRRDNLYDLDSRPMIGVGEIIATLLSRWKFIAIFTLAVAFIAFSVSGTMKRKYEAETSVLVDPQGIQFLDGDNANRSKTSTTEVALIESMMRIMRSERVLNEVVKRENLDSDPEFNGTSPLNFFSNFKRQLLGASKSEQTSREILATHKLRKAVGASRPKLSYVIELSVLSEYPQKAAHLANTIANIAIELEVEARSNSTQKAADGLEGRIADLRVQLNEAENRVEQYKLENNILDATGQPINEQELAQVNRALVDAGDRTAASRAILEEIRKLKKTGALPTALPAQLQSQTIANLRLQLSRATQEKITLSAQYLSTHPVMKSAELRIADIKRSIFEELDRIAEAAKVDYNSMLEREKDLQAKVVNLSNRAYSANDAKVRLRELERDVESKRVVYEAFLLRARELGEQVSLDTTTTRIISPAIIPIEPAGISPKVYALAGTIAGFGLACVLILTTNAVSLSRQTTAANRSTSNFEPTLADADTSTASRGLGGLLGVSRKKSQPANDFGSGAHEQGLPILIHLSFPRGFLIADQIPMLARGRPNNPVSGRLKNILDAIFGARMNKKSRTVLVTGFVDGFARSAFSANLAHCGVAAGSRVLLVNADEELASTLEQFSHSIENELAAIGEKKMVVGENAGTVTLEGFQNWPFFNTESTSRFYQRANIEKLKDRITAPIFDTDLAVIDGPLIGEGAHFNDLVELADEVILVIPENALAGEKNYELLSSLGSKINRIRGVVKVSYTS